MDPRIAPLPRRPPQTLTFRPSGQVQHGQGAPCAVCGKFDCRLKTHRDFIERVRSQGFRKHDLSRLMSSSFASSYSFNPLAVAVDYVCSQLHLDIEPSDLGDHSSLPAALTKFIRHDIGLNTPFTDPAGNRFGEVASEWLVATSVDEIACISTLNLWLMIEWTNTKKPALERYCSKLTSVFLEQLRKKVEGKEGATAGTIFAASNHLTTCLIFYEQNHAQWEVMLNGLEALINTRGGFGKLTDSSHPGLFISLLWNDIMFSSSTGARPRFPVRAPPPMPHSLIPERVDTSEIPIVYQNCCGPDLLDTARYLRLFLLFRHDGEVRELSKAEYQYLVALDRYVHAQLLDRAGRYHEEGTMSECIALAITTNRMNILCTWEQLGQIRRMITQRFESALKACGLDPWLKADAAYALIWVCWVALTQTQTFEVQSFVLDSLVSALKIALRTDPKFWPEDWGAGFAGSFQPLLWHADYDAWIPKVIDLVHEHIKSSRSR